MYQFSDCAIKRFQTFQKKSLIRKKKKIHRTVPFGLASERTRSLRRMTNQNRRR